MEYSEIIAYPINKDNIKPYGELIDIPECPPTKFRSNWKAWSPVERVNTNNDFWIGIVEINNNNNFFVEEMERHIDREELVWPGSNSIIQPLALNDKSNREKPDIDTLKVFIINPNQVLKINAGVWHSAANIADKVNNKSIYFFAIQSNIDDYGDKDASWVKLEKFFKVKID